MEQRQIISHTLLSLMLLTSGSLYGCSRQDSPPKVSTPSPSEAKIDPLKISLGEVQKQLKLVETSLDSINSGLDKFVETKKDGRDIDFETIKSQWQDFKNKWKRTEGQLDSQNEIKSKLSSLKLLENKIKSFDTTIRLLNKDIITQSQDKIKLLQTDMQIPPINLVSSGTFGRLTQQTLELKITSDITEIELGLLQIEQVIGHGTQKQPTNLINNPVPDRKNHPIMNALLALALLLILTLGVLVFSTSVLIVVFAELRRERRKKVNLNTHIDTYSERESLESENKQLRSKLSQLSQLERQIRELESEKKALTEKNIFLENLSTDIQKLYSDIPIPECLPESRPTRENPTLYESDAMIHRVNIATEEDLITYYNSNPKVLENSIEIVTASEESIPFKGIGRDMQIIFKNSKSGNYWLLWQPIIRDSYKYYCLVPKAELVVNQHNYNTIRYIFYCTNYENRSSSKFHLKCPAFVQKNQQGCWELITLGEIIFDPEPPPPPSPIDLQEVCIPEWPPVRYELQEVGIPEWPPVRYELQEVVIPQPPPITEDLEFGSHLSTIATDKNEQQLIKDYNKNDIKGRYGELIEVSSVSGSIESSRGGSGDKPILTKQSPSKYWIIQDKYLVPQYFALDKNAMASVQNLFDCPGYQQEVSGAKDFTLQRTGKVQKVGDSWELVEKGVLDYNK